MSKALKNINLTERSATRALVAISLSFTLVAFGCTTDRTLGNGDPVTTPGLRSSPIGGTSTGTESAPSVPPSMTSSSSVGGEQALPLVTVRNGMSRADQAAAIMAQHQPRERYLGPAFPGTSGGYYSDGLTTGQFQNPALRTNPQLTINSSLTSGPNPAIVSGAGDGGAGGGAAAILGGAFIGGADAGTGVSAGATLGAVSTGTTAGTTAAAPVFGTGTTGLSTVAPSALPTGTLAATATPTTTPTAFSAIAPSPLLSTSPALAEAATAARTPVVTTGGDINGTLLGGTVTATGGTTANLTSGATASTATTAATTATGTTALTGTTARVTAGGARTAVTAPATAVTTVSPNPVRITTDASGRRVITNVNTTTRRNQ